MADQGLPEGYTLDQAAPSGYTLDQGGIGQISGNVGAALGQNLSAAMQHTSPIVSGLGGQPNYQRLGGLFQSDAGPAYVDAAGKWQMVNPQTDVVLNDPQTNLPTVFARSPDTNEGLASIGRLLGFGGTAPSSVSAPSLVAPAAKAVGGVFASPENRALGKIGSAIAADRAVGGPGVNDIMGALQTPNTPAGMTAIDVGGENLRALAGQAARVPGPGRQAITSMLNDRDAAAGQRLADAVSGIAQPGASNFLVADALNNQAKTAAAPLYGQAYLAPPINPDIVYDGGALDKLMSRPSMKGAATNALRIAQEEGRNPASLGIGFNQAGDPIFEQVPSWQTLDYVKRGLDDVLNGYRDTTTGRLNLDETGRAVDQTRRQFLQILDDNNPAYAAARAAYSGPQQTRAALLQGADALNKDPDQIASDISSLSPGDQNFYRLGAANALKAQLAKTSSGGNEARAIVGNQYRQSQLRAIFPQADNLINAAGAENTMFGTRNALLGNSATAGRLAQDTSESGGLLQPLSEGIVAASTHEPVLAAKAGLSFLRNLTQLGHRMTPEVANSVISTLLSPNPGPGLLSAAQRGAVPALRPSMLPYIGQMPGLLSGEIPRQ